MGIGLRTLGALLIAISAGAGTARADLVWIDFDADPDGNVIAGGTAIDSLYAGVGVAFSAVGNTCTGTGSVYAHPDHPGGFGSLPNVVSTCDTPSSSDIAQDDLGTVFVSLAYPASQVCIAVRPNDAQSRGYLGIYDEGQNGLGIVFSTLGATETLCIAAAGIRYAAFSGDHGLYARFDDLVVAFAPEPGAAPTGLAALAGLASLAGRRSGRTRRARSERPPRSFGASKRAPRFPGV